MSVSKSFFKTCCLATGPLPTGLILFINNVAFCKSHTLFGFDHCLTTTEFLRGSASYYDGVARLFMTHQPGLYKAVLVE